MLRNESAALSRGQFVPARSKPINGVTTSRAPPIRPVFLLSLIHASVVGSGPLLLLPERTRAMLQRMLRRITPQPQRLQIQIVHRLDVPDRLVLGPHEDARRLGGR